MTEVAARTQSAVCMFAMNGARRASESPPATPEKIWNSVSFGTAAVMIASTNAIEMTAPVFWSIVRAPPAIPRRRAGTVPIIAAVFGLLNMPERRGIAGGARTMLQNTGAVISIAFVLAIITAAVPKDLLFRIFSGVTSGLSDASLEPFIANMHTALWVLAATSVVGAVVCLLRPSHVREEEAG